MGCCAEKHSIFFSTARLDSAYLPGIEYVYGLAVSNGGRYMKTIDRQVFYRSFRRKLTALCGRQTAERIWNSADREYCRILCENPGLRKHKGAMVLPAVALYRAMKAEGLDAEKLLNSWGDETGRKLASMVHVLTGIPGLPGLLWNNIERIADMMSSEKNGYRRRLVSEPPVMYGVDILSCPYHNLAKLMGEEKAVLCICHLDKAYMKGFRKIRYERGTAVSEGAPYCDYRLRFDPEKE